MILALALTLLAQTPQHWLERQPNLPRAVDPIIGAAFYFAPSSGVGMGGECAGTVPQAFTSAGAVNGTFTRATAATCVRGDPTAINNGDLVKLTSGQPRVMRGLAGAPIGVLMERSQTNLLLRSEAFDNASWTKNGSGVAAPTVTADFGVAPDATTTAERVQIAACPANTNNSTVLQAITGGGAGNTNTTVYVKGNGTAGQINVVVRDTTANAGTATLVTFNASTWARGFTVRSSANATIQIQYGCANDATIAGSSNTGAVDVLLWGAQAETFSGSTNASSPTSYIPTVGATVVRNAEQLVYTPSSFIFGSEAVSWVSPIAGTSSTLGWRFLTINVDANNFEEPYVQGGGTLNPNVNYEVAGAFRNPTVTGNVVMNALNRLAATYDDATHQTTCLNGTCTQSAVTSIGTLSTAAASIYIGMAANNPTSDHKADGVISRVCIDSVAARCR